MRVSEKRRLSALRGGMRELERLRRSHPAAEIEAMRRVRARVESGQLSRAAGLAEALLADDTWTPRSWTLLSHVYLSSGEVALALDAANEAVKLAHYDPEARLQRACVHLIARHHEAARCDLVTVAADLGRSGEQARVLLAAL